jgi:erythromycin esterase-like protein
MAVWAHNSHLGDASATGMAEQGEWNVGELMRQRWGDEVFSLGFTTYEGTVRAADEWDEPGHVKRVRPGLPGSWEELFHEVGHDSFLLLPDAPLRARLDENLLERAIGVIYLPETERRSHYFTARIGAQFDGVIHIDCTQALEQLAEPEHPPEEVEVPETYPAGV